MGLGIEMKNLTEELLTSFKNRIKENEELVMEVQKTLDGFRKDHQEMADALKANAAALRKGLANEEKDRLNAYKSLMADIHGTIASIQNEVVAIQNFTFDMINQFTTDRGHMADELNKFFSNGRADRMKNEETRMADFDALMKSINNDIKNINNDVATIFNNTNDMIARFEKEHQDMSAELRAELGKNLAERIEYTRTLLNGFQKKLAEISKENLKMVQKLRKDIANGEFERLKEYTGLMKEIHLAIKGIRKSVMDIQKDTAGMLDDLLQNRVQASAEWSNMQKAMVQIRETGVVSIPADNKKKVEKKEAKKEILVVEETKKEPEPEKTLEEKVLDYINKHPNGLKISDMETPMGETRMKLGYVAKKLLDEGKVLKVENLYYPKPKTNL